MKRNHLLGIVIAIASLLTSCTQKHKEQNPMGEPDVIPVKTSAVSVLTAPDHIDATGLVSTEDEARYSFKIGGVISRIFVDEGQFFKNGQLLATLNATEISAGLEQSSLSMEKARRDYGRAVNLYRDSVYTLEQLQNTKTALDIAVKAREATAFNEQYSKIYAASDGFVTQKMASEGEVVNGGMPVLLINSTRQHNSYVLKVGVTDREWAVIKPGQPATVTLDGYGSQKFDGVVFRKSQAADTQLGSFQVEFETYVEQCQTSGGHVWKSGNSNPAARQGDGYPIRVFGGSRRQQRLRVYAGRGQSGQENSGYDPSVRQRKGVPER